MSEKKGTKADLYSRSRPGIFPRVKDPTDKLLDPNGPTDRDRHLLKTLRAFEEFHNQSNDHYFH